MSIGPLINLTPNMPYIVSSHIMAADIRLDTKVKVKKPFNLGELALTFEVSGKDLADVFYLTGLALPNTPPYRLVGSVEVSGTTYRMNDLTGRLGSSDIGGQVVVEARPPDPSEAAGPKLTSPKTRLA